MPFAVEEEVDSNENVEGRRCLQEGTEEAVLIQTEDMMGRAERV
jgi:hypothetical protein